MKLESVLHKQGSDTLSLQGNLSFYKKPTKSHVSCWYVLCKYLLLQCQLFDIFAMD